MRSSGPSSQAAREALEGELLEARGERGELRAAGGPGGQRDLDDAVRVGLGERAVVGVAVGVEVVVLADHQLRAGALDRVLGLEPAEADRQRQQRGADGGDGDLERHVAPHVRQRDGDDVAGLDAALAQVGGEREDRAVERVEAQLLAVVVDGERVAADGGVRAQVAERVVRDRLGGGGAHRAVTASASSALSSQPAASPSRHRRAGDALGGLDRERAVGGQPLGELDGGGRRPRRRGRRG